MNVLFVRRLALLGALLTAEWLPISALIVTRRNGQAIARGVVVFTFLFLTFGYLKSASEIRRIAGLARSQRSAFHKCGGGDRNQTPTLCSIGTFA